MQYYYNCFLSITPVKKKMEEKQRLLSKYFTFLCTDTLVPSFYSKHTYFVCLHCAAPHTAISGSFLRPLPLLLPEDHAQVPRRRKQWVFIELVVSEQRGRTSRIGGMWKAGACACPLAVRSCVTHCSAAESQVMSCDAYPK